MSVADAFERIRKRGVDSEMIYTCYVTESRKLIGTVSVKDLLLATDDCVLSDIMETNADNSPVCYKINEVFHLE